MIIVRENLLGKFNVREPFKNPVVDGSTLITFTVHTQHTEDMNWILKPVGRVCLNVFQLRFHRALGFRRISSGVSRKIVNSINKNYDIPRKLTNIPRNTAEIFYRQLVILQQCRALQLFLGFLFVFIDRGPSGYEELFQGVLYEKRT
jgi:hypothetical protein